MYTIPKLKLLGRSYEGWRYATPAHKRKKLAKQNPKNKK